MTLTYADTRRKEKETTPTYGSVIGTAESSGQKLTPGGAAEKPVVGASVMGSGQAASSAQPAASGQAGGGQSYAAAVGTAASGNTPSTGGGAAAPSAGNGAYQTTYIDSNGNIKQGYIIGGVTYKDAAGAERIDPGTRVLTQGGEYILRQDGTSQLYSDYLAENRSGTDYLETLLSQLQTTYQKQIAAGDAAAAAATQQAINRLEAQKGELNTQYDDLNRQLYIDRRQDERTLPQQLAAMGYTGGLSESSLLRLGTSYEEALRQNESDRAKGLSDIDLDIENARLEGEIAAAQQRQTAQESYYSNYANIIAALAEQSNWRAEYDSAEAKTRSNSGWTKLEAGIMPNQDELDAMGMTYEQALGLTGGSAGSYTGGYYTYAAASGGNGSGDNGSGDNGTGGGYNNVARELMAQIDAWNAQASTRIYAGGLSGTQAQAVLDDVNVKARAYINSKIADGSITADEGKKLMNSL